VVVPPVDHECSLLGVVAELSNQLEKVKHELAQLKKAHIGPKSERSKMPRVPTKSSTPEERLAKRRAQAADRAQTETVRTEHKVPPEERTCPSCGNDKLKPIGEGRKTTVYEFVPARFVRHEHVQEVRERTVDRTRLSAGSAAGDTRRSGDGFTTNILEVLERGRRPSSDRSVAAKRRARASVRPPPRVAVEAAQVLGSATVAD